MFSFWFISFKHRWWRNLLDTYTVLQHGPPMWGTSMGRSWWACWPLQKVMALTGWPMALSHGTRLWVCPHLNFSTLTETAAVPSHTFSMTGRLCKSVLTSCISWGDFQRGASQIPISCTLSFFGSYRGASSHGVLRMLTSSRGSGGHVWSTRASKIHRRKLCPTASGKRPLPDTADGLPGVLRKRPVSSRLCWPTWTVNRGKIPWEYPCLTRPASGKSGRLRRSTLPASRTHRVCCSTPRLVRQ